MESQTLSVKERILLIASHAKMSKLEFFRDLQMSYANFKGVQKKSGLSSDALLKILNRYPEVCPSWLLLGEGEMLRKGTQVDNAPAHGYIAPLSDSELQSELFDAFKELRVLIEQQVLDVASLSKRIEVLEKKGKGGKDTAKKKKKK